MTMKEMGKQMEKLTEMDRGTMKRRRMEKIGTWDYLNPGDEDRKSTGVPE